MAHTDVVNVDPKKWTHPPFSATRQGGYVYGRGTVDDKDNVAAALMMMLTLKRLNVPLDRDVIALFEAGEEGSTRVGIQYMVDAALPRHRRRVLLCRGRRRDAAGRPGEVRLGADAGEDPARHPADRAGRRRPRVGAAAVERRRAPVRRGRQGGEMAAADPAERDDRRLFQAPRHDLVAGGGRALSQRAQPGPGDQRRRRRVLPRQRAAARVDAAHVGLAQHVHRRLPRQRDPLRGHCHARRADAARRGPEGVSRAGEAASSTIRRSRSRSPPATRGPTGRHASTPTRSRPSKRT